MQADSEHDIHAFTSIEDSARVDEQGLLLLGQEFASTNYRISTNQDGELLLTPIAVTSERDMWLYRSPRALSLFRRGLSEAMTGQMLPAEDFSQYSPLDEE